MMSKKALKSITRRISVLLIMVTLIFSGSISSIPTVFADSTSGSVNYAAKWNSDGSAVNLTVTPEKAGTVYYLMQNSGYDAPTEDTVKKSGSACDANTSTTINLTSDKTAKDIYVIYKEDGSSSSYTMSKLTLPKYSDVSSTGSVSISAERNGSDKLSLSVTPTITGTLQYIVRGVSEAAPSDDDFSSAKSISESADITKKTQISLGDDPTAAKKVYLRYYTNNGAFVAADVMDIPALNSSSFGASIDNNSLNLGTVFEGYSASDAAATATITNEGSGTVSFSVDTTADGYADFSKYFNVDTSGAEDIASGDKGSITVTPKEGLSAGTYTGTFSLVDKIDDKTLTLGPVTVKMTVNEKGDSTVEDVRTPEGKYTPSIEWTTANDTSYIKINGNVAYCVNYYYNLTTTKSSGTLSNYQDEFGLIPDVTNKELDAYTGIGQNNDLYPPNNYKYSSVKEGSSESTIRDDVARVLYYGYPNDALNLIADGNSLFNLNDVNNYVYCQELKVRDDFSFELATQFAIWHYTDGIDFSDITGASSSDPRVEHVKKIYNTVPSWGWKDVQNLYNFLVGNNVELVHTHGIGGTRGIFRNGVSYPSNLQDAPDGFAVDLYVANNPVKGTWTQNLATGRSTTDVSITKIWADQSNAYGRRPDADTFESWIHLYDGGSDVTDTYKDNLTVTDNGNNTYTVTYKGLPSVGHSYKVVEEIPEAYSDIYKIPSGKNSATDGGSIKNYTPTEKSQDSSLTITKTDSDGNVLKGAKFTLYSDENCETRITDENAIVAEDGTVSISTGASYLKSYLPTENNKTATVYLKETTAPTGYSIDKTVYPITLGTVIEEGWNSDYSEYDVTTSHTITYNGSVTLTVSDQPVTDDAEKYEKLTITKVSDDGTKLDGAVFTLYSDAECNNKVVDLTPTDSNGTVVIDTSNLPGSGSITNPTTGTATYYLKETTAPTGYTASDTVYTIVLGTSVSSAWNSDHTKYVTTTTHTIRCNDSNELRVTNTNTDATVKNSELTIMKSDADTGSALKGAIFALYTDDKIEIDGSEITTDSNGKAYINTSAGYLSNYLPTEDGTKTFYLKETTAPGGYKLSDKSYPITITRSTDGNVTTYTIANASSDTSSSNTLTVENTPATSEKTVNSSLTVYKVDEHTKQPLPNAEFTLYSDQNCKSKIQTLSGTDENGNVKINTDADYLNTYLPAEDNGDSVIYLKETKAPSGYSLNDKVYTLTINKKVTEAWNADHTEKVKTTTYSITNNGSDAITVDDKPVVNLEVKKQWENGLDSNPVTIKLTRNGETTDDWITLDENREWTDAFEGLPKYDSNGKEITYGVVEVNGSKYYNVSYQQNADGSITVANSAKSIHTTVSANRTRSSSDKAAEITNTSVNVVDTVTYSNLDTDTEYTLKGELVDVTDTNNIVSVKNADDVKFTPTTSNGTQDVSFGTLELDKDHTYVVYETLYVGDTKVAEHKDSTDKAQTFVVKEKEETPTPTPETPTISTTVSADGESSTSKKAVETSNTSVKVVDKVSYENLTAGTEYTLQGQLMDVTDKDNIVSVGDARTTTFTPTEANGTKDLDLGTLDLTPGHTYVVYETLYKGSKAEGTPVAEHKDKDDKAQTVVVKEETPTPTPETPSIRTTISADGERSTSDRAVKVNKTRVNVVDTVYYKNLTVGKTYTLKGKLIDVTAGGKVAETATMRFKPEKANGHVKLDFGMVDLKPGHKYVAFESLYKGKKPEGTPVTEHKDKNNKAQTIVVSNRNTVDNRRTDSGRKGRDSRKDTATRALVKTGDTAPLYWGGIFAAALIILLVLIRKKRSSER